MTYSEAEKLLQTLPKREMIFNCEMVPAIVPSDEVERRKYVEEIDKMHDGLNVSETLDRISSINYSSSKDYELHWFYKKGITFETIEVGKEQEYLRKGY